jgi:hypothetical protein
VQLRCGQGDVKNASSTTTTAAAVKIANGVLGATATRPATTNQHKPDVLRPTLLAERARARGVFGNFNLR